jgi:hypothetical protein
MIEQKKFYDVWMYEISDEIQQLAIAFGERYALESALLQLQKITHEPTKELLIKLIRLHCIALVKKDLSWY